MEKRRDNGATGEEEEEEEEEEEMGGHCGPEDRPPGKQPSLMSNTRILLKPSPLLVPPPSSPSNTFNLLCIIALIYITKANTWEESSKCLCNGCDVMYYVALNQVSAALLQKAALGPYC